MKPILVGIASAMCSSCGSSDAVRFVSPAEYRELQSCWVSEGRFQAFVVINIIREKAYPYFISPFCNVSDGLSPKSLGSIRHLRALKIEGDNGLLKSKGLYQRPLQSTLSLHGPRVNKSAEVYIVTGEMETRTQSGVQFYSFKNVDKLQPTKYRYERFIETSPEERYQLFRRLNAAS